MVVAEVEAPAVPIFAHRSDALQTRESPQPGAVPDYDAARQRSCQAAKARDRLQSMVVAEVEAPVLPTSPHRNDAQQTGEIPQQVTAPDEDAAGQRSRQAAERRDRLQGRVVAVVEDLLH